MHAAARLVCGLSPRDHVTSALRSLHWLTVKQRIELKLCLLVHQTINGRALAYLKDLIQTTASVPDRASNRSASNNEFVTRRTRLKLGERAFSIAAPRIWNQLPIDIKAATDTRAFKEKLKKRIFIGSLPAVKLMIRRIRKLNCHLWNTGHYIGSNRDIVLLLLLIPSIRTTLSLLVT